MTLKNNRAPLLCYFKLCALFCSHRWIQTGVTIQKRPIWVKMVIFFNRVTLKFDGWPWNKIGLLSASTSSSIWVKIRIFFSPLWPWNLTDVLHLRQRITIDLDFRGVHVSSSTFKGPAWLYSYIMGNPISGKTVFIYIKMGPSTFVELWKVSSLRWTIEKSSLHRDVWWWEGLVSWPNLLKLVSY